MRIGHQKLRVVLGLLITLSALHFIPNRLLVGMLLVPVWSRVFSPITAGEWVLFLLASVFFLIQNYICLRAGLFEFASKDILLMPYYEPLLWGFYFLSMKRFVSDDRRAEVSFHDKRSVVGLVATSLSFSLFSFDARVLLIATLASTVLLLLLFHTTGDLSCALYALILGLIIELFGVSTSLWSYPAPDVLGIPYWFATMWISVGVLGRRFLIPAADSLGARIAGQRA
jgi:hypothetical protein